MLRFVVLFALVAAAFAEPEAELGMAGPGMVHHANGAVVPVEPIANQMAKANHLTAKFGMPYALPYALPYASVVKQVPKVVPYTVPVVTPLMKTYSHIFKREAESKPEADPLTVYPYSAWPYSTIYPQTYAQTAFPYPYPHPIYNTYSRIFKREAESKPEADPLTVYTHNAYAPYTYTTPYTYTHTYPYTYTTPRVVPSTYVNYNIRYP